EHYLQRPHRFGDGGSFLRLGAPHDMPHRRLPQTNDLREPVDAHPVRVRPAYQLVAVGAGRAGPAMGFRRIAGQLVGGGHSVLTTVRVSSGWAIITSRPPRGPRPAKSRRASFMRR